MKSLFTAILIASAAVRGMAADGFKDSPGEYLDILHNGNPMVRYMYACDTSTEQRAHETYKVYHHVMNESGTDTLTKGPGYKFTHHRGLFIGWNRLQHNGKGSDLWHMTGGALQRHRKILKQEADATKSVLSTQIDWIMAGGETVCIEEVRTVTVDHTDKDTYLLLDFVSELKAVDGDVVLKGDPEHAGMQYRAHQDIVAASTKYLFHEEGINPKDVPDLPWAAMTYTVHEKTWTVQHMNHPDNPKGSKYSAYRDYGRFGCYPAADIKSGETLTLKYRIRITPGEAPSREVLAKQYDRFVQ